MSPSCFVFSLSLPYCSSCSSHLHALALVLLSLCIKNTRTPADKLISFLPESGDHTLDCRGLSLFLLNWSQYRKDTFCVTLPGCENLCCVCSNSCGLFTADAAKQFARESAWGKHCYRTLSSVHQDNQEWLMLGGYNDSYISLPVEGRFLLPGGISITAVSIL